MTGLTFDRLKTRRLVLEPLTLAEAQRILDGDLGGLRPDPGWPHRDTHNGLRMALRHQQPPGWLVIRDGEVIGDCGTHGPADREGTIEIGYGLSDRWWGKRLGTELVGAMTAWLLGQPGVSRIIAHTLPDNRPSQRVLEKNGFVCVGTQEDGLVEYERRGYRPSNR